MSIYENLDSETLVAFYFEIHKNIERGILTKRMHQELKLIEIAATNKGITLLSFHRIKKQRKGKKALKQTP